MRAVPAHDQTIHSPLCDEGMAVHPGGHAMGASSLSRPEDPLPRALWQFNLAPSTLVHASRRAALLPTAWQAWWERHPHGFDEPESEEGLPTAFHRHWSAALLKQRRLGMVTTLDDPRLPLALAGPALFERLLASVGGALLGPAIRRIVLRSEVARIESQLGPDLMQFVRREAAALWPGNQSEAQAQLASDLRTAAHRLGAGALACAFTGAPAPVGARAQLRLPAEADLASAELPRALAAPEAALQFVRSTLQALDPQWLSLFPAPR